MFYMKKYMKKSTIILFSVFGGLIIAKGVLDLLGYNSFYSRHSAQRTQVVKQLVKEAEEIADTDKNKELSVGELSKMLDEMGYRGRELEYLTAGKGYYDHHIPYVLNVPISGGGISIYVLNPEDINSRPPIQIQIPKKTLEEYVNLHRH